MTMEYRTTRNDKAILAALLKAGRTGMTETEIIEATELRATDVRTCLKNLGDADEVMDSFVKKFTPCGPAKVYWHPAAMALGS